MSLARLFARRDSRSPSRSLGHEHRPAARRHRTHRPPHVERLEDRTLLSGWALDAVGAGDDPWGYGVATDSTGNVYVAGFFVGTFAAPGVSFTSAGDKDVFVAKYSPAGTLLWAQRAGGLTADIGRGIAVDSAGNVSVTGYFTGTADFGSTTLTSAGNTDIFVAKLDTSGNWLWAKRAGATGSDLSMTIALDTSGNIHVGGKFQGTVNFGGITLTGNAPDNSVVWKLDAGGNSLWAVQHDTGNVRGIAVDNASNVYTTGQFSGTVDFDPGPGSQLLTGSADGDISVWKLDSSGNFVLARAMGAPDGADTGWAIAVDAGGNMYTTGYFFGTADLDPGPGSASFTSYSCTRWGSTDLFVSKLDATGNLVWAVEAGGAANENVSGASIALDSSGNVYASGSFYSRVVDFDPGPGTAFLVKSAGVGDDGFVWKLDSAGNFGWVRRMGGTGYDRTYGLALDGTGNVYATGAFQGTATFDVGMSDVTLTAQNGDDLFVAKITQDGGAIIGRVFNDSNNNGIEDSTEARLEGWTVYLDQNNNGVLDSGEPSVVSGQFGEYQFRHLTAGTYTVRDVVQSGWTQTLPAGGLPFTVTLGTGEFAVKSFGNFNPAQSPAGWEATPSGCKDLQTGLIWASDRSVNQNWHFWSSQDAALNVVQDGFSDYGLAAIRQLQTASEHGILQQLESTGHWSTSLVNNNTGWGFNFETETVSQAPVNSTFGPLLLVRGSAVPFADDGDPQYTDTVTGWTTVTGQGKDGDYRIHASGSGTSKATWTFTARPASQYKVLATWVAASSNANNAPYKIYEGSTLLKTKTANQRNAPSSKQSGDSIPWADLGTVTTTGGVIKVELANNASGNVVADMVRLVPISPTGVAAMVTSRDVQQRSVDAVIASHYFDNDDRENNLTLPERLDRHTLRDLLRARRLR